MERNKEGNADSVSEDICLGRLAMEFYEVVDFLEICNFCYESVIYK